MLVSCNTTLEVVDKYVESTQSIVCLINTHRINRHLRETWLECCKHMSSMEVIPRKLSREERMTLLEEDRERYLEEMCPQIARYFAPCRPGKRPPGLGLDGPEGWMSDVCLKKVIDDTERELPLQLLHNYDFGILFFFIFLLFAHWVSVGSTTTCILTVMDCVEVDAASTK